MEPSFPPPRLPQKLWETFACGPWGCQRVGDRGDFLFVLVKAKVPWSQGKAVPSVGHVQPFHLPAASPGLPHSPGFQLSVSPVSLSAVALPRLPQPGPPPQPRALPSSFPALGWCPTGHDGLSRDPGQLPQLPVLGCSKSTWAGKGFGRPPGPMPVRAELPSGSEQGLRSDVLPFNCLQGWGAPHTSLASVPTLDLPHGKGPSSVCPLHPRGRAVQPSGVWPCPSLGWHLLSCPRAGAMLPAGAGVMMTRGQSLPGVQIQQRTEASGSETSSGFSTTGEFMAVTNWDHLKQRAGPTGTQPLSPEAASH